MQKKVHARGPLSAVACSLHRWENRSLLFQKTSRKHHIWFALVKSREKKWECSKNKLLFIINWWAEEEIQWILQTNVKLHVQNVWNIGGTHFQLITNTFILSRSYCVELACLLIGVPINFPHPNLSEEIAYMVKGTLPGELTRWGERNLKQLEFKLLLQIRACNTSSLALASNVFYL